MIARTAVLAIALSLVSTATWGTTLCRPSMRRALVEGRFGGPIVCSRNNASLILAGRTTGTRLTIYDYRYRFLTHKGGVWHGGQRLMVFSGNAYIGNYLLSPPRLRITVEGTSVVLKVPQTGEKVELDFSKAPPRKILVNGELEQFQR